MANTRDGLGRFIKGTRPSPSTEFKKGHHWRKPQLFRDRNWLHNEYILKKRTSYDIAKDFNVTGGAITFWLKKHNISRRNTSQARKIKHWGSSGEKNPMFNRRGDKHPNWHGGVTLLRQKTYNRMEGKKWFKNVYARDGKQCRLCGEKKKLIVHHILPIRKYPFLIIDVNNGIVLCNPCHLKIKRNEMKYAKKLLNLIGANNREGTLQ